MKQTAQWIDDHRRGLSGALSSSRLPLLKFLMRYPVFLLAFGPPLFRSAGVDATKGVIDFWSFCQVGLLLLIAIRAMYRLASAETIFIPKQIRPILKLAFVLGLLFLASAAYSPSRLVTAGYSIFYFFNLICVIEFVADAYRDPPNWLQCLFHLRSIALILLALVLVVIPFAPILVLRSAEETGIRLVGGSVAPTTVICPMIALISAYSFLHGLESRVRSLLLFLIGLASTLITLSRGAVLALLLSLAILGVAWARTNRRLAYTFISACTALILFSSATVAAVGGSRLWYLFNRGQDAQGIATASGRTDLWKFVIQYCMIHPQGMGYVAGFRDIFRGYFSLTRLTSLNHLGNAHNSFMQVLADAGWLALAVYLIMMIRIVALGLRNSRKRIALALASERESRQAIECSLLLLVFYFANGMDSAEFVVPLRSSFYLQNLIVAIILGASASLYLVSRREFLADR